MRSFNIENYLYNIDKSFALKGERDKMMIFVMIFAGLFAFSYLLFWESSEASFKISHDKALAMTSSILKQTLLKRLLKSNRKQKH
jgi:hypothetical protein